MSKLNKEPRRKQAAWSAPSVAKRIERNWETMTTEERKLLSDAVRFCNTQHSDLLGRSQIANFEAWEKVEHQRETYRARLAKLRITIRRQAEKRRKRTSV